MKPHEKADNHVGGVVSVLASLTRNTKSTKKPSAYEFREAYQLGLAHAGYTGDLIVRMHFNQGVMTKWSPYKEDRTRNG